jgi:hypothetical protein
MPSTRPHILCSDNNHYSLMFVHLVWLLMIAFSELNTLTMKVVSRVAQSVQCLATGWTTGRSMFDPGRGERIFPAASVSRPALGPTQPPVQWVPGVLSPGIKCSRVVTLTTHPHLVPKLRMSRNYISSPFKRLRGV